MRGNVQRGNVAVMGEGRRCHTLGYARPHQIACLATSACIYRDALSSGQGSGMCLPRATAAVVPLSSIDCFEHCRGSRSDVARPVRSLSWYRDRLVQRNSQSSHACSRDRDDIRRGLQTPRGRSTGNQGDAVCTSKAGTCGSVISNRRLKTGDNDRALAFYRPNVTFVNRCPLNTTGTSNPFTHGCTAYNSL